MYNPGDFHVLEYSVMSSPLAQSAGFHSAETSPLLALRHIPDPLPGMTGNTRKNTARAVCRRHVLPRLLPVMLGGLLLAACSGQPDAPASGQGQGQALPVAVLAAQPVNIPRTLEIMAQTEGAKETEVRARVGGLLVGQLYREGEPVKAGQALFQIDRAPYANAYDEAQARASQTARERARFQKLLEVNAVSRKEYDDTVANDDMAQAALRQAGLNLSWTAVTAPVDGVSGRAEKSVGNLVTVGADSLLTRIHQNNPIWARFSITESEAANFVNGPLTSAAVTSVELVLPDGSIYPHPGKLNFLASSIDTTLGTQQLRAEFPNAENRLLPGQFVRVHLVIGQHEGVFRVPQTAVIQSAQGDMLMLADAENKVTPRPVRLGEWAGSDWIVLEGLHAGDRVIVNNLMKLRPGMPVAPHAPGQEGGQSAAVGGKPQ
jgi:membrane fusion protein (multidrug efflux system)